MLTMNQIIALVQVYKDTAEFSLEMIACDYDLPFTAYFDSFTELEEMIDENNISANPVRLHADDESYPVSTMVKVQTLMEVLQHPDTDTQRMQAYSELIEGNYAQMDNVIKFFEDNKKFEFTNYHEAGQNIADGREIIKGDLMRKYFNYEQYAKDLFESEFGIFAGFVIEIG